MQQAAGWSSPPTHTHSVCMTDKPRERVIGTEMHMSLLATTARVLELGQGTEHAGKGTTPQPSSR